MSARQLGFPVLEEQALASAAAAHARVPRRRFEERIDVEIYAVVCDVASEAIAGCALSQLTAAVADEGSSPLAFAGVPAARALPRPFLAFLILCGQFWQSAACASRASCDAMAPPLDGRRAPSASSCPEDAVVGAVVRAGKIVHDQLSGQPIRREEPRMGSWLAHSFRCELESS